LAIAWMLLSGLSHAPAVFITVFLADLIVRGGPGGLILVALISLVLTLGYTAIAASLRRWLQPEPRLDRVRQLNIFVTLVTLGSAAIAAMFVGVLLVSGMLDREAIGLAWLRFWVGDAVGIVVTAPLLLVVADSDRRTRLLTLGKRGEIYLQGILLGLTLWLIFGVLGGDPAHHFYLLFLPLIWIAVRNGMAGAIVAIAVIQVGVVLAIHHFPTEGLPIFDLQVLVAALTVTGMYLAVMVDERERAVASLKQSFHLAAAGEMAGAITHELNQPLTALMNYGRSALILTEKDRVDELRAVIEKMVGESQRASEVVRRLRDFFRGGTTRLEPISIPELLNITRLTDEVRKTGVELSVLAAPDLPLISADRLQLELVLRNLLSNAVDATKEARPGARSVVLSAQRDGAHFIRVTISDNGLGIPRADRERIFEPFVSGKPTGMGLGLAVSRAIVEAHGGALRVSGNVGRGEIQLTLPVAGDDD
jgi:two-component system, LuxR family, sensor kinase FixL